jgi:pyruvate formate lyase activating enzyme
VLSSGSAVSEAVAHGEHAAGDSRSGSRLRVGGLTPFTSIDFPGQLSAVVWVQGCPWRCGYCHNPHLQARDELAAGSRPWPEVVSWLGRRVGLIDAVVFSGGEPTIDVGLRGAMEEVRALGLAIGLHTGGIYPRRLAEVLPLVDWVGMDVKAPLSRPELLDQVVGVRAVADHVARSLSEVLLSGVKFECRTTAHPAYLAEPDLLSLAAELSLLGVQHYALQIARPVAGASLALDACAGYPSAAALAKLEALFPAFTLRRE